jgi:GNAT superfamily N-acetyltransferase
MSIEVRPVAAGDVAPLRELHRFEMHCQIVHDSFLGRSLCDPYLLSVDGRTAGYGLVANRYNRGAVDEFYVAPAYRARALPLFRELIEVSKATGIRCQTNDPLLLQMLYDCGRAIKAEAVLFADALTTSFTCDGVFRKLTDVDKERLFAHHDEPGGDYGVELGGTIVATGGALFHYNPPYGDIFMEVDEPYRRRGIGSYLVQELKRVTYEMGKVPAARCNAANVASRLTLQKAGLLPCGRILTARIARQA